MCVCVSVSRSVQFRQQIGETFLSIQWKLVKGIFINSVSIFSLLFRWCAQHFASSQREKLQHNGGEVHHQQIDGRIKNHTNCHRSSLFIDFLKFKSNLIFFHDCFIIYANVRLLNILSRTSSLCRWKQKQQHKKWRSLHCYNFTFNQINLRHRCLQAHWPSSIMKSRTKRKMLPSIEWNCCILTDNWL